MDEKKSIKQKGEYVAVPTSDVEEAMLPAYEEVENPAEKSQRRRRRFRFLLIGGAIALLGLTHLCSNNMNDDETTVMDYENREPCALRHDEQYSELKQHMNDLKESFGDFHHGGFEGGFNPAFVPPHDGPGGPPPPPPPPHHGHHGHHKHHHHHKEHKGHKKHHGHKHHDEPAPPAPPPAEEELSIHRWFEEGSNPVAADEVSIANNEVNHLEGHRRPPHHGGRHPYEPFCKVEELEAASTVFSFSPEEFKRAAVFLNGYFSRGGHVRLIKSSDESVKDVKLNVTVYTGREDLQKEVKLSAFDHEGQYTVQIEREHFKRPHRPDPPHHPRHPHRGGDDDDEDDDDEDDDEDIKKNPEDEDDDEDDKEDRRKENCLVYNVDIEFPSHVDYFEDLELHIKSAQRIHGGKGIEGIEFGSVKAGLGHGAIIFDGLRAKKLMLGVINGVVMGTYQPGESFSAGTIRGATKVHIEPTGDNINITATSTFGPASVDIPADSYSGDFALFNLFGETSTIQAPNPEDIHVTKFRHTLKAGYYKEEHTGSKIVVAAKLHGGETLTFK